ncbi:MAG: general stress protein CsbD [Chitinophaga sp.]|uniref:general stress protein CsbD n=1 Tax=Chitinophaga sp. TaxID=1869181 RepID=UPI0025B96550|nr:general stress protein CsbD [Chitinophaga sp.]MBV8251393.1 general stress protein CsbD [Chitinophaga sp.]
MNTQTLKNSWSELQTSLKQKYSKLKDEDLKYVAGKEEDLYTRIQSKLGMTREEVDKMLDEHHEQIEQKIKKAGAKH